MLAKRFIAVLFAFLWIGAFAACEKKREEGPAERAGKKIDKAMEQLADKSKEAADRAKEATKK